MNDKVAMDEKNIRKLAALIFAVCYAMRPYHSKRGAFKKGRKTPR